MLIGSPVAPARSGPATGGRPWGRDIHNIYIYIYLISLSLALYIYIYDTCICIYIYIYIYIYMNTQWGRPPGPRAGVSLHQGESFGLNCRVSGFDLDEVSDRVLGLG